MSLNRIAKSNLTIGEEETPENPYALSSSLVRLATEKEEQRIGLPRASSLYDACMRMHVLGTKHKLRGTSYTPFNLKLTFAIGEALHLFLQNYPDIFGDRRRGLWKCRACREILPFSGPPTNNCRHCGARPEAIQYYEYPLLCKKPPITGHPDMFLAKRDGRIRVAEFKTINGEAYEELDSPLPGHVWQLTAYMWICSKRVEFPVKLDTKYGYLFYFSKKHSKRRFPMKCFPVTLDKDRLAKIITKLNSYAFGIATKNPVMPEPHEECLTSEWSGWRAKGCPALRYCKED